ncbi:MAG: hypothetical protein KGD63_04880 [Candidatus Lokiarchaeota archaeon]|nr:hypothetical protein [Candidatus Lokiarchaeota archaeon]
MDSTDYDDILLLGKVLNSKTCLLILQYLASKDASNQELYEKLKNKTKISYRSSIFEALKRIKKAGLVEKYYNDEDKQIKYRLRYKTFSFDFGKLELEME